MTKSDKKISSDLEDEIMTQDLSRFSAFFAASVGLDSITESSEEELAAEAGKEVLDRSLALRVLTRRLMVVDEGHPELGIKDDLKGIVQEMFNEEDTSAIEDGRLRAIVEKAKPFLK